MKGDVQYRYFFAEVFLHHPVSKTRNEYKYIMSKPFGSGSD